MQRPNLNLKSDERKMSDVNIINPSRIRFARKRRGLTIKKLSDTLGLTARTLSSYENGKSSPTASSLKLMAEILKFPEEFFFMDEIQPISVDAVSFRSQARMSATTRDAALHASHIALEFTAWISNKFETPAVLLPDLSDYQPEAAAEVLRNEWSIGQKTISNMVHLLEAKGVMVFSLVENTDTMDAYSFWMNHQPFVFLNTKKSVERSRFDAAHELGHLVLHAHGAPKGKEIEAEANRFASAFLMSEKSVRSHWGRYPRLSSIVSLKRVWGVSASALLRRLRDLDLLTEWHYRSLCIELSRKGGMKQEPNGIERRETSKLLPMLFQALRDDGINKQELAKELGYYPSEIDAFMFNLTITEIGKGRGRKQKGENSIKDNSHLRLVK